MEIPENLLTSSSELLQSDIGLELLIIITMTKETTPLKIFTPFSETVLITASLLLLVFMIHMDIITYQDLTHTLSSVSIRSTASSVKLMTTLFNSETHGELMLDTMVPGQIRTQHGMKTSSDKSQPM